MAAGSIPSGQARSRRLLILFVVVMFGFPFLVVGSSAMLSSVFPGWAARVGLAEPGPLFPRLVTAARLTPLGRPPVVRPGADGSPPLAVRGVFAVESEEDGLIRLSRACQTERLTPASPDDRRRTPELICVGQDRGREVRVLATVSCTPDCRMVLVTESEPPL